MDIVCFPFSWAVVTLQQTEEGLFIIVGLFSTANFFLIERHLQRTKDGFESAINIAGRNHIARDFWPQKTNINPAMKAQFFCYQRDEIIIEVGKSLSEMVLQQHPRLDKSQYSIGEVCGLRERIKLQKERICL